MGLAEAVRGAASTAEASGRAERQHSAGLLASLIQSDASFAQDDERLALMQQQRRDAERGQLYGVLGTLGSAGIQALLGGKK